MWFFGFGFRKSIFWVRFCLCIILFRLRKFWSSIVVFWPIKFIKWWCSLRSCYFLDKTIIQNAHQQRSLFSCWIENWTLCTFDMCVCFSLYNSFIWIVMLFIYCYFVCCSRYAGFHLLIELLLLLYGARDDVVRCSINLSKLSRFIRRR